MKEVLEEKLPYVNSFVLVKKKMMKPKYNYVVSLPFLLFRLLFSSCFFVVKHKTSEAFGYMSKNNSYFSGNYSAPPQHKIVNGTR